MIMRCNLRTAAWITMLAAFSIRPIVAQAQQADAPAPPEPAPAAEAAPADATPAPGPPAAPPPPGEEVMRPTEHGLRLTPDMARAMTRAMAAGMGKEFKLTTGQQEQLSDGYARRLMEIARKYEEQGQAFSEYAIESIWMSFGSGGPGMKFTPDMAREFSQRAGPVLPAFRELIDGLDEEARAAFPEESYARFHKELEKPRQVMDRFEEKMQRWSQGQMKEGEHPFSDLDEPATRPADAPPEKPRTPEVRQAEQMADWTLSTAGITEWRFFLNQVKEHFKFDEQQSEKATRILADYTSRAEAIMTPEWKEAVRQNRIKVNLRNQLKGVPTIPWMWRLQHEYDTALKPIRELGWSFRKDILALLTPQQREAALSEITARAVEHGLSVDDKDQAILGLAGSTWSLWKF